jgi:hypothetical protein
VRWSLRAAAVFAVLTALVLGVGLVFTGLPVPAKTLTSGLGVSPGSGRNVLEDPDFVSDGLGGSPMAQGWLQEHNTTGPAPAYIRKNNSQEIAYNGQPGDTGVHHKIEIFQAIWHGVHPGQRWRFSIKVKGQISKGYIIVGMEWFSVFKHVVHHVVGYGYNYIAEQDVYPQLTTSWQRFTAVSPRLPRTARCVAVYVQLPEINYLTHLDVTVAGASLVLTRGS